MKISYAIPVWNEHIELERLIMFLSEYKREEDEIVVLCDEGNTTIEVEGVLTALLDNITRIDENPLNKDFAQQKNYLTKICKGDWVFLIDADELPNTYLLKALPEIIHGNPDVEAYWVPRINTVEGLTEDHTTKWKWNVDGKGWVNFPDYQMRLYKNDGTIKWINPVHEQLTGFTKFAHLPTDKVYCLNHPKDIKRQESQNKFYEGI